MDLLTDRLHLDTRMTILGHFQRGGAHLVHRQRTVLGDTRQEAYSYTVRYPKRLIVGQVKEMQWMDFNGWLSHSGIELGIDRDQPSLDLGMVSNQLQDFDIQNLILIGGFGAYTVCLEMYNARGSYPAFCMPMVHITVTIRNNVPGAEYSLGADTSLNAIMEVCDATHQNATASRKHVFVVEVHGGQSGVLAVVSSLAVRAASVYSPEEGISLAHLKTL